MTPESQSECPALKSPTTSTGKRAAVRGEVSSGSDAVAIHLAISDMSCSVVLCDIYVPPMMIGVWRSGDDTHINITRVRDSLGLYGVLWGMSWSGRNVHELCIYIRMEVGSDGCELFILVAAARTPRRTHSGDNSKQK